MTAWFLWTRGFNHPWASIVHREYLLKHEKPGANSSTLVAHHIDDDNVPTLDELVKLYPAPEPPEE